MVSRARRLTLSFIMNSFLPRWRGSPSPGPAAGAGSEQVLPVSRLALKRRRQTRRALQAQCQPRWREPASRRSEPHCRRGHCRRSGRGPCRRPGRCHLTRLRPRSTEPAPAPDTHCEFVRHPST